MTIVKAEKQNFDNGDSAWILNDEWGHEMFLPCPHQPEQLSVDIGVLGTRVRDGNLAGYQWAKNKTKLMAAMLLSLDKPIYLIDTRRNGVGGQGSWSPREFASLIPDIMKDQGCKQLYSFIHLPILAPSIALLNLARNGLSWQEFKKEYQQELYQNGAIDIAVAFIEATACRSGICIFLCAEEYQPDFINLDQPEQNECYCHRYALAKKVAREIDQDYKSVRLCNLDLRDFKGQWQNYGNDNFIGYQPNCLLVG